MDWTQVLTTLITVLVPTGGICGLFTIREKKVEMMLGNASKLNDGWTELANEYKQQMIEKDKRIEQKEAKIDELYCLCSTLRHDLDDSNTRAAVAEVKLCDNLACGVRTPPLGRSSKVTCHKIKGTKEVNHEQKATR